LEAAGGKSGNYHHILVLGAKELVQRLSEGTKLEMEGIDYLMARLRAELGTRPEDWGTDSAFKKLGRVVADMDGLFGTLDDLTNYYERAIPQLQTERDLAIVAAAERVQLPAVCSHVDCQEFAGRQIPC
jgi:hypothetical protein